MCSNAHKSHFRLPKEATSSWPPLERIPERRQQLLATQSFYYLLARQARTNQRILHFRELEFATKNSAMQMLSFRGGTIRTIMTT